MATVCNSKTVNSLCSTESDGTSYCAATSIYQVLRKHCAVYEIPAMTSTQKKQVRSQTREVLYSCIVMSMSLQIICSEYSNLSLLSESLVSTSLSKGIHIRSAQC